MKKMSATAAVVAVLGLGLGGGAVEADAGIAKFSNCRVMHEKFPGGVARNAKVVNTKTVAGKEVVAKSTRRPKVNAAVYKANKGLDRDGDGIVCER